MSYITDKCDPILGQKIHNHLLSLGLETPMTDLVHVDQATKIASIRENFRNIMETLGLDLTDDSLQDTPNRVAKMYVREVFWGLDYNQFPKCTAIENKMSTEGSFVLETDITSKSFCEHHVLPINSFATVAYIPKNKVLGLSKLNRIVDFFSRRPQVQERLTEQIRAAIAFITETEDVAVYLDGKHMCVSMRGIQDVSSSTVTLSVGGVFRTDKDTRSEFLALARQ